MTDFAACAVYAVNYLSIHHNTAANAGTQGGENHILAANAAALPALTQGSHSGIIAGGNGEAGQAFQLLLNIKYTPAQIHAFIHRTVGQHRTGDTDAQADNVSLGNAVFLQMCQYSFCNIRQDIPAVFLSVRGNFPLTEHISGFVKTGKLHSCAAQINTKSVFHSKLSFLCPHFSITQKRWKVKSRDWVNNAQCTMHNA